MNDIDEEIERLKRHREAMERNIKKRCQEQLIILEARMRDTMNKRQDELLNSLRSDCDAKEKKLLRQQQSVLWNRERYSRICETVTKGLPKGDMYGRHDDRQLVTLVRQEKELWSEMTVSNENVLFLRFCDHTLAEYSDPDAHLAMG